MPKITITHQEEKTKHHFTVKNPDSITRAEVNRICQTMRVQALFINGKYYELEGSLDLNLWRKYNKIGKK